MLFENHAWVSITGPTATSPGEVAVYNVYSDTLISTIPVGVDPRFLQRTPDGTKVYVPNSGSNNVSVICTSTNKVIATIPVGSQPRTVAVDPTSTTAYVTNFGSGTVSVINVPSDTVVATIPVGTNPLGIAISPDGKRVYVSNNGDNTLSVINPVTNTVVATVPVGTNPNGVAVSTDNSKVYVVNSSSNDVSVINTATNSLITTIPVGLTPLKVAVNPVTPYAYVTNFNSGSVSVISTATNTVVTTIPGIPQPSGIAVTADGSQIWVANDFQTTIINAATNTIMNTITVPPTAQTRQGVTVGRVGSALEPGAPIDLTDPYQLEEVNESVCIIVEKVYASCQQRECFPDFPVALPPCEGPFTFVSISFANGVILPNTIVITPIPSRPNFSRVQFTIQIPFTLTLRNAAGNLETINGILPDVLKDIVLYFPPTRPEFDLNLRVETRSELLAAPLFTHSNVQITVGTFIIVKVTGLVQLLVPSFGYCPEPPECEEFPTEELNPCLTFFDPSITPFPSDFFPPQLDNAACDH